MTPFAKCCGCQKEWTTWYDFNQSLKKKEIRYLGNQPIGKELVGNLYNHETPTCNTSFLHIPNQEYLYKKQLNTILSYNPQ